MKQLIKHNIKEFSNILNSLEYNCVLLVCDSAFKFLPFASFIKENCKNYVLFNDFTPNPVVEDAKKGIEIYNKNNCDCIVAVGGGSAIDVAKYIKLNLSENIPFFAIPTTAGTGSESTQHIVVYENGIKQSIASESVIPNYVILDATVLETLPFYQKVSTAMDAFFQGVESFWSVRSNTNTKAISKTCLNKLSKYVVEYFKNEKFDLNVAEQVMEGANLSGQAINLTQTTIGHAMSYKLSSMFKIAHGHAVAICMYSVWKYTINYIEKYNLVDVKKTMLDICESCYCNTLEEFSDFIYSIIYFNGKLWNPKSVNYEQDIEELVSSVKPERLKNNPIIFSSEDLREIYSNVVQRE